MPDEVPLSRPATAGAVPPEREFHRVFASADEARKDVSARFGMELADVAWPLVSARAREVESGLRTAADLGLLDGGAPWAIQNRLVRQLYTLMFGATSRAMVVEMAAAESTGLLPGETPEERYGFFAGMLNDPSFCAEVLGQYPVLVEQLLALCGNWRDASLELFQRLAADRELIGETFFAAAPAGRVADLEVSAGDAHRRGRSTTILRFAGGVRLVYKPRPVAVDVHFRALADWLNDKLGRRQLLVPLAIDRGEYGWSEFISHEPLSDEGELATYYERMGALLAVAYLTGLSDLHTDNVIAHRAWPVAVDLETLFRPCVKTDPRGGAAAESHRLLDQSVLATQLLAIRVASDDDGRIVDLGGIADLAGHMTPFETPVWRNLGRVDARLDRGRLAFEAGRNLPVLDGVRVPATAHGDAIRRGFAEVYRVLLANREELRVQDGPLAVFAEDTTRVVLRGTTNYARLLSASYHPDFLRESGEKKEYLARFLARLEPKGSDWQDLVAAEIDDLWQGDIPCFTARAGSREIVTSRGVSLAIRPAQSGLELAFRRLEGLGEADLARQRWLIRLVLARSDACIDPEALAVGSVPEPFDLRAAASLVARKSAEAIAARAILDADRKRATWLTVGEAGSLATVADAGLDLYSGLPGIALFLTVAGRLFDEPPYRDLARCALDEMLLRIEAGEASGLGIGGFAGSGGLAWAFHAMDGDFPDLDLGRRAAELILAADHVAAGEQDVTHGLAGALMCCLAVHRKAAAAPDSALAAGLLERATAIGALIADRLEQNRDGAGPADSFAHGGAGLAAALARLFATTGETRLETLAKRHLDRAATIARAGAERGSWCRGQAGLVIALAEGADLCADPGALPEALSNLARRPVPADHSLCHGSMGMLTALSRASATPHDVSARLMRNVVETGLVCGTVGGVASPGLMDGLAGIGLGALGILAPGTVPCVLALDSVPARSNAR